MSVPTEALRVVPDAYLPWEAPYGVPLSSLLESWAGSVAESSVLRTCALLGLAIDPMGAGAFFAFGYLIASYPHRFPELAWTPPDAFL